MITLPWPDKALSPNNRTHWAVKAKAVKVARRYGAVVAREAGYSTRTYADYYGKLHIFIRYFAKTRNYPDADNCLSASKAYLDGIADALGLNDRRFIYHPMVMDETGGRVEVRIDKEFSNN
jgi:hypothetical protein